MGGLLPIWQPANERVERSQMHQFMRRMGERHGVGQDWESLRRWAIRHREVFWPEMLEFAGIDPDSAATCTVDGTDIRTAKWFPGMRLNYARHLLRHDGDRTAIRFEGEDGARLVISYRDLRVEVAKCAAALKRVGVGKGDRVGAFMPNLPETLIAMLATASVGAIWSSCSPDFGINGVLDRFGQIEPSVLLATTGYRYNGKAIDTRERVVKIRESLASVRRVVVVPYGGGAANGCDIADAEPWDQFVGSEQSESLSFESVEFDHPLFIMYSSGTTGTPKCIVHGHGGTLVQHMKELMLHCDVRPADTIFYFTTCGWMMWNWLVSSLGVGATVLLFEGSPGYPRMSRLWELAEDAGVTVFGTSPKFIAACQKSGVRPGAQHDLSHLRCLLSTGSPLSAEQFEWVYREVKSDLQLSSICGGTDIISCFMLGNPMLPVYAGQIQCRGLGMDVQAYDETGRPVQNTKGELVCASAFPSRPIYFWNDGDGAKYKDAYFSHFDGVWRHGDWIEVTEDGGVIVYGRSDATLNPGGVRIGTAEIYRIVEEIDEITDSVVVGKRVSDDVEICLFVVLREGLVLTSELSLRIQSAIAAGATKRHVPKYVRPVSAIPHTISGKKVELAVTQMIHGEEVKNRDVLANPDSLDQFRNIV